MKPNEYTANEMLICSAARIIEDGTTVFVGTGVPMLAAALAQKMHAPRIVPIFEFGGTGAILNRLPLAVGDSRTFHRAVQAAGICDVMETAQRGFVEYGFLGGAQIDPRGNLNTTVIGPHNTPKVRLPGSGGGNDVGSLCWRIIAIMPHDRRRFVERLDFLTTPGYLSGPGAREAAGLPPGTGPYRVVTTLGVFGYHPKTLWMQLLALNPGVTIEDVRQNTGFEVLVSDSVTENPPPSDEELRILRTEVDPDGLYR